MLELTPEQAQALEKQKEPLRLVNPRTQEVFVLVRHDIFNLTSKILKKWDDPGDADLIEQSQNALQGKVRMVVEELSNELKPDLPTFERMLRDRQAERGHVPRTKEKIDAYLNAERASWES